MPEEKDTDERHPCRHRLGQPLHRCEALQPIEHSTGDKQRRGHHNQQKMLQHMRGEQLTELSRVSSSMGIADRVEGYSRLMREL